MRLIADGIVDREGVPGLAARLGYSVRQLQRMLLAEVGAGPIAIARAQRAQTARVLVETTKLTMTEIAFASGFASVRQFNDTIRTVFATAPTALRRRAGARRPAGMYPTDRAAGKGARAHVDNSGNGGASLACAGAPGAILLRLPFRRPLCPDNLFGHLAATAVPGVEEVVGETYRRTLRLPHGPAIVELTPTVDHVACRMTLSDLRDLTTAIARCRWLLDLDADPQAVDELLSMDPALASTIAMAAGRRVPRCVDGPEFAVRAVLGQQVSTAAARTHAARIVAQYGEPLGDPRGGLTHLFPEPGMLSGVQLAMPASRTRTLAALIDALSRERLSLDPGCDRAEALSVLSGLPGFGPWTTQVIAMRALGDPDAFPASDLGVRRAAEALGLPAPPVALTARAERWRPWRAYAVQYLWSATPHPINHWPLPASNGTVDPVSTGTLDKEAA
jgi:AraC family transcriptional regulator of adaptative response / DNA-3-methyladenine glycosylase II